MSVHLRIKTADNATTLASWTLPKGHLRGGYLLEPAGLLIEIEVEPAPEVVIDDGLLKRALAHGMREFAAEIEREETW